MVYLAELYSFYVAFVLASSRDQWIVGSSLIVWAEKAARTAPRTWPELTCDSAKWYGQGGMGWSHFRSTLRPLLARQASPRSILIHLGSNNLGKIPLRSLIDWSKAELQWLANNSPDSCIIWSDILARRFYTGARSQKQMEANRKVYNSRMRSFVIANGGKAVRHLSISWDSVGIFRRDGVHLNAEGNRRLNSDLQGALIAFSMDPSLVEYK